MWTVKYIYFGKQPVAARPERVQNYSRPKLLPSTISLKSPRIQWFSATLVSVCGYSPRGGAWGVFETNGKNICQMFSTKSLFFPQYCLWNNQ